MPDKPPSVNLDETVALTRRELNALVAQAYHRAKTELRANGQMKTGRRTQEALTPEEVALIDGLLRKGHHLRDAFRAVGRNGTLNKEVEFMLGNAGYETVRTLYACEVAPRGAGSRHTPTLSIEQLAEIQTLLALPSSEVTIDDIALKYTGSAKSTLESRLKRSGYVLGYRLRKKQE